MFNKAVLYGTALAAIPALALDVVFMVDESGSMGNEQATLKAQIPNIFAGIQAVDANSRAALVGFGTSSGGGDPRLRQALTTDQATFTTAAQSLTANGSFEPGFRAIIETANDLIEGLTVGIAGPYCAVIFTDEDSDGAETQAAAQTALTNSAGSLFSVTNGQADYDNIAVKFYDLNSFSGSTATTIINDIIANCAVVVNEATFPPTTSPTAAPSTTPTVSPTSRPTVSPTAAPSTTPTVSPTAAPSTTPTVSPTATPTVSPTAAPSQSPTVSPTAAPTVSPIASCGTVMGRDVDSNTYLYSDASHPLNSIGWGIYWKDDAFTGDAVGATKSGVIVTGAKRVCVGDWSAEVLQGGKVTFTMTMKSPWLIRSPHLYVSTVRPTSGSPGLFPYKEGELETPFDTSNMYQYQNSVTWTVTPVSNDSKKYVECLFSDRRLLRANNKKGGNDEESEAVDCSGQPLWVVLHASVSSFEGCDYELMDLSEYVGQAECPNNS